MTTVPSQSDLQPAIDRVKRWCDLVKDGNRGGLYSADLRAIVAAVERLPDAEAAGDALNANVTEFGQKLEDAEDLVASLRAELAEARRVIEPFATAAMSFAAYTPNTIILNTPSDDKPNYYLVRKDFDAAAAYLAANPTPEAK